VSPLAFWEWFEYVATAIVLVAVIGEYVAEFTEWANTRGYKDRLGKLATLVLIVGVAGELLGVVNTTRLSGQQIAILTEAAEREHLERVKIEQQAANRDFTPEQLSALSSKLSGFAGQRAVVDVFPVTFEHAAIAGDIAGILENARWNVRGYNMLQVPANVRMASNGTGVPGPLLVQGIQIQATADERSQAAAAALFEALKSTVSPGNLMRGVPLDHAEDPRVWIYVGDKPTPLRSWVK
jgi:hypothetical protein